MAKLITVFLATGKQGGAVARALLAMKGFQVRAVTRKPDSEKASALKNAGAEVVKADLSDAASVEIAVQGTYGVFLVTDYWGLFGQLQDPEKAKDTEITQGKEVGGACKKAGVKHLVYSGMELVQDIIGVPCPHFDSKGIVEKFLDDICVPNTSTRYPAYYDNFATPVMSPQKQEDGTYAITLPMDGPVDGIDVEDAGPAVASVFANPDEFIGKKIGFTGDKLTIQQYMDVVAKLTGKTIKYNQITPDQFAQFPFPGAADLAAMFDFNSRGYPDRDLALTKRLNPGVRSFEQWAFDNKDLFEALYSS